MVCLAYVTPPAPASPALPHGAHHLCCQLHAPLPLSNQIYAMPKTKFMQQRVRVGATSHWVVYRGGVQGWGGRGRSR